MTGIRLIDAGTQAKPSLFAGVDVGAEELVLVIRKDGKPFDPQKYANSPSDHTRLVKKLGKLPGIVVCLEARGFIILTWLSPCMTPGCRSWWSIQNRHTTSPKYC